MGFKFTDVIQRPSHITFQYKCCCLNPSFSYRNKIRWQISIIDQPTWWSYFPVSKQQESLLLPTTCEAPNILECVREKSQLPRSHISSLEYGSYLKDIFCSGHTTLGQELWQSLLHMSLPDTEHTQPLNNKDTEFLKGISGNLEYSHFPFHVLLHDVRVPKYCIQPHITCLLLVRARKG